MFALALVSLLVVPSPSVAQISSLTVQPLATFSVVGNGSGLRILGSTTFAMMEMSALVQVVGPGRPSSGTADWPITAELTVPLGDLQGDVDRIVSLPVAATPSPGAYEARVTLMHGDREAGAYSVWLAAVAPDQPAVDLAVVLPLMRGFRQDVSGIFVDSVIRDTAAPVSDSGRSVYLLASLLADFPAWHFTVALEPDLLSQLEDQSDGFRERSGGVVVEYAEDSTEARQAQEALAVLQVLAREPGVELIPTPYTAPALTVLAAQGWGDGTEQMRLGKAVCQSALQPLQMSAGAYAPGLDLVTGSLAFFGQASVDYVVASAVTVRDLAEPPADPLLPVRISDNENNRVTLLPVSSELSVALSQTWDVPRFFAAVASLLADGRTALVVAPANDYATLAAEDLQALGSGLSGSGLIRTVKLSELLERHPPSSRPVFLSRFGGYLPGLMAQTLTEEIRQARGSVEDLVDAAGPRAEAVSAARLALFRAQSRYWLREGADPSFVNMGIDWAREAARLAGEQLGAVTVGEVHATGNGQPTTDIAAVVSNRLRQDMSLNFQVVPAEGGTPLVSVREAAKTGDSTVTLEGVALSRGRYRLVVSAGFTQLGSVPFAVGAGGAAPWWVWAAGAGMLACGLAALVVLLRRRGAGASAAAAGPPLRRGRREPS